MADFAPESELLRLAIGTVEKIPRLVNVVESKLADSPEEAKTLMRPCGVLVLKLLEAQGSVEGLMEKLHFADLAEPSSRW